jgi:hypothetical protein
MARGTTVGQMHLAIWGWDAWRFRRCARQIGDERGERLQKATDGPNRDPPQIAEDGHDRQNAEERREDPMDAMASGKSSLYPGRCPIIGVGNGLLARPITVGYKKDRFDPPVLNHQPQFKFAEMERNSIVYRHQWRSEAYTPPPCGFTGIHDASSCPTVCVVPYHLSHGPQRGLRTPIFCPCDRNSFWLPEMCYPYDIIYGK